MVFIASEAEAKAEIDKATREQEQKRKEKEKRDKEENESRAKILPKDKAPSRKAPQPPSPEEIREQNKNKEEEEKKKKEEKRRQEQEEQDSKEQGIILKSLMKNYQTKKIMDAMEMKDKEEKERKQKEDEARKKKNDEEYKIRQEQEEKRKQEEEKKRIQKEEQKRRQEQEKKRKEEEEKIRIEREKYIKAETARKQKEEEEANQQELKLHAELQRKQKERKEKEQEQEKEKSEKKIESEKEERAKMLQQTAQTTEHREKKETEIRRPEPQKPTVQQKIRNVVYGTDRPGGKFYVKPSLKEEEKLRREDENWARKNIPEDYQKNQKLKTLLADVKEDPYGYPKFLPDDPAFLPYNVYPYRNEITFRDEQQFETEFNPQLSNIFGASDAAQRGESGLSDLDRARRELPEHWVYGRDWIIRNNRVDYIGPHYNKKQFWNDYDYISITNRNAVSEKEDRALQLHHPSFINYVRERVNELNLVETKEEIQGGHFHFDEKSKKIIPHSQAVRDILMPIAKEYIQYIKNRGPQNLETIQALQHDPNADTTRHIKNRHIKGKDSEYDKPLPEYMKHKPSVSQQANQPNNLPTPQQQPGIFSNMLNYVSSKLSRPDPKQPLAPEDRQLAPPTQSQQQAPPQQTPQRPLDIPAYRPQPTMNESRMLQPPPSVFPSYKSKLPSYMPPQRQPAQSQLLPPSSQQLSRQQSTFQSRLPQVSVRPRTKRTPQYSEAPLPSTSIRDVNIKKPTNNPLPEKPDFTFLESLQQQAEPSRFTMRLREREPERFFETSATPTRISAAIVALADKQKGKLTHEQAIKMKKEIVSLDQSNPKLKLTLEQKNGLDLLIDKYTEKKKKNITQT